MSEINNNLCIVILAGGKGTRFWPLSTSKRPKQFLALTGNKTLLQQTYERIRPLAPPDRIIVLTNLEFVPLVQQQLEELPDCNIIGEPLMRDTAAPVALAAVIARKRFGDCVMAVLPSDHDISPDNELHRTIRAAVSGAAENSMLYTIGINPTFPATGYGYLEKGESLENLDGVKQFKLVRFKEKPDLKSAEEYIRTGKFYWNAGQFVWRSEVILEEIRKYLPLHYSQLAPLADSDCTPEWESELAKRFELVPKISIDYGVMEKTDRLRVVEATYKWNDIGSWSALNEIMESDENDNCIHGKVLAHESKSNMIYSEDPEELIALVNVENMIIVRAGKKTLIIPREEAQAVKKLVEKLTKYEL